LRQFTAREVLGLEGAFVDPDVLKEAFHMAFLRLHPGKSRRKYPPG
jgi:hypothetical protein